MKILFYCQHVLGIGHFFRSLEICEALREHNVVLVTGGPRPDVRLGGHIREIRMPGLMMDPDFSGLFTTEENMSTGEVKALRRQILFDLLENEAPDIFIVELYPFGRKAFRFELDPALERVKERHSPRCRTVCSLRDILVEKKDPGKYETRVVDSLNRWFDALLVHSDPALFPLDETFSRVEDIRIPVFYTGFVAPKPPAGARDRIRKELRLRPEEKLAVVSAGGGKVGARLLEAAMIALKELDKETPLRAVVFSGPFMEDGDYGRLVAMADERMAVSRFTPDFLSFLSAADLSVSMAGYNTCMNILACGVPAAVWPFSQNREQRLRAERLARKAPFTLLNDGDLVLSRLAPILRERLLHKVRTPAIIDLHGASNTAGLLESGAGS